jgi:ABC-type transporter Mla maintaining outer membrane lipid asymmetry permease subunit MlaE
MGTTVLVTGMPARQRALGWAERFVARVGHLWAENPWTLVRFSFRLAAAWRCVLFELSPRQVGRTLWRFIAQTSRTFFRGIFVILGLGIAIGFGIGAVSRAVGPALQPDFAAIVVTVLLRDAAPLVLILFLTARMGASITARLGSDGGRGMDGSLRVSDRELTWLVLPHLVAGTVTGAAFYSVGAYCIVKGYLSQGDVTRFFDASPGWYLRLGFSREALLFGAGKSLVFGNLVAYVAAAYGIQARERPLGGIRRVDEVQDAVWETSVTSILLATALSVLLWLTVEAPLR